VSAAHVLKMIETGGPGGAERVMINIAGTLAKDPGWRVSAVLQRDGWLAEQLRAHGVSLCFLPLRRQLDVGFLRRVVRQIRDEDIRLIHSHEFGMNFHGAVAAKIAGIPCVATVHGRTYYGTTAVVSSPCARCATWARPSSRSPPTSESSSVKGSACATCA
jgi:hypothetical protein